MKNLGHNYYLISWKIELFDGLAKNNLRHAIRVYLQKGERGRNSSENGVAASR